MCLETCGHAGRTYRGARMLAVVAIAILTLAATGCSNTDDDRQSDANDAVDRPHGDEHAVEPSPQRHPSIESVATTTISLPALQVDPDASTVDDAYPGLASAALVHARLGELPDGVVLQAEDVVIWQDDIEAQIAQAPAELREQLRKNAFSLLEQMATQKLLVHEARQSANPAADEQVLLQSYFQTLVQSAQVSDSEVAEFYEANREMIGGAPLEQMAGQIRKYLLQGKQQEIVYQHVQTIAQRTPVVVSVGWVETQARLARDNPVDQARASGKPTLASFGADSCVPCRMMVPTRKALREKYADQANIIYVQVDKEQILASRYGVQGIPLLVFFDADGREFHRHTGVMSQEQIEEQFRLMDVRE